MKIHNGKGMSQIQFVMYTVNIGLTTDHNNR